MLHIKIPIRSESTGKKDNFVRSSGTGEPTAFLRQSLTSDFDSDLHAKILRSAFPPQIKKVEFEILKTTKKNSIRFYTNLPSRYLAVALIQGLFLKLGRSTFERDGEQLVGYNAGGTPISSLRPIHVQKFGFSPITIFGHSGAGSTVILSPKNSSTRWVDPILLKVEQLEDSTYSLPISYEVSIGSKAAMEGQVGKRRNHGREIVPAGSKESDLQEVREVSFSASFSPDVTYTQQIKSRAASFLKYVFKNIDLETLLGQ